MFEASTHLLLMKAYALLLLLFLLPYALPDPNLARQHDGHRICSQRLMSSQWKAVCLDSKNRAVPVEASCKAYFRDMVNSPKTAWYVQCVARVMVERGFQLPVYIVHDGKADRFKNIYSELVGAGIKNESVTWVTQFKADSLSQADLAR